MIKLKRIHLINLMPMVILIAVVPWITASSGWVSTEEPFELHIVKLIAQMASIMAYLAVIDYWYKLRKRHDDKESKLEKEI